MKMAGCEYFRNRALYNSGAHRPCYCCCAAFMIRVSVRNRSSPMLLRRDGPLARSRQRYCDRVLGRRWQVLRALRTGVA